MAMMAVHMRRGGGRDQCGGADCNGSAEGEGELAEHGGFSCGGHGMCVLNMGRRRPAKGSKGRTARYPRQAFAALISTKKHVSPAFACPYAPEKTPLFGGGQVVQIFPYLV